MKRIRGTATWRAPAQTSSNYGINMRHHSAVITAVTATLASASHAQCLGSHGLVLEVTRINSEVPSLADVNQDGAIDLLTVDGTGMLRLRRAVGDDFAAPQTLQLPPFANLKPIRDMDGDGNLDLLVSCTYGYNCGSNLVRIYWNSGSTTSPFDGSYTEIPLPASPYCIEADAMDFNGDGRQDVVITSMLGTACMHRNLGSRQFALQSTMAWPRDLYYRSTVDVDGDGKSDFMAMHKSGWADGQWGTYLYRGNGAGGFAAANVSFAAQHTALGFSFDPNGTTRPGIAVGVYTGDSISQILQLGTWSATASQMVFQPVTIPMPYYAYQGADVNNDGFDDLVLTATGADSGLGFILSDGTGSFTDPVVPAISAPGFDFGKLHTGSSGDRYVSIVAATNASTLRVYRSVCAAPACIADLNGDGVVGGIDLGIVLGAWGSSGGVMVADVSNDGIVDGPDLGLILSNWGPCPN